MTRWSTIIVALLFIGSAASWQTRDAFGQANDGWVTLLDGKSLDKFSPIGDANWRIADGAAQADKGTGFLVSKNTYKDFQIKAEFWVDDDANSGIFIRCEDPAKITSKNAYEVNIFDKRPDPTYGTGAIVDVAKVVPMPKAGGKWNTYEIIAKGPEFTVIFNGVKTVDAVKDAQHSAGHVSLQYAGGVVKFRSVQIKPL